MKRIGLTERTGRGVDLIYQGLLRYGRPAPDYSRTTPHSVVVALPGGKADLGLLRIVLDEERRRGSPLPVDSLIALGLLRNQRRVDTAMVAKAIQRDESAARNVLERLVEAGLAEAHGVKKGRTYTLSPRLYREAGEPAGYVRQAGFGPIQQEQMVLRYVREHARITRSDVADLCQIGDYQATRLLDRLVESGQLVRMGAGRGVYYQVPESQW
jgi:ATP-dependent DNA helicase RecG